MTVTSSLGETVVINRVCQRCPLMIQGLVFPTDLMELPFHGFRGILRMDWLIKHKEKVDFEIKWITL